MRKRLWIIGIVVLQSTQAHAECGTRGGPGYRGPTGKCVGWAEMARVCGNPPETRCKAELVAPHAAEAAEHGAKIEELRKPSSK